MFPYAPVVVVFVARRGRDVTVLGLGLAFWQFKLLKSCGKNHSSLKLKCCSQLNYICGKLVYAAAHIFVYQSMQKATLITASFCHFWAIKGEKKNAAGNHRWCLCGKLKINLKATLTKKSCHVTLELIYFFYLYHVSYIYGTKTHLKKGSNLV